MSEEIDLVEQAEEVEKEKKLEKLDYDVEFQKKVVANLLFDEEFLKNNYKLVDPLYFVNHKMSWAVGKIIEHYKQYSTSPDYQSLTIYLSEDSELSQEQKESLVEYFARAFRSKKYKKKYLSNRDHIQDHVHQFCWQQNLTNALFDATKFAKTGEFEKILPTIQEASRSGEEVSRAIDYDDVDGRVNQEFRQGLVKLPWASLNNRIGGGIGSGEFIAWVGAMGSGKSLLASNVGVGCRKQGYTAVLFSIELGKNYIRHRTDTILTRTPIEELEKMKKNDTDEYADYIRDHIKDLHPDGKLLIQYVPTGSTVADIKAEVKWLQANGYDIDLIIIDYLDKMSPLGGEKGKQDWQVFEDITVECRDFLCREMDIAGIGMVQGNTSSLEEDAITATSTSGGARRLHPADVVLGYARPPSQKNRGKATLSIVKNRFGKDAISLPVETDYSIGYIDILDEEFDHTSRPEDDQTSTDMKKKLLDSFQAQQTKEELSSVESVDYE